MCTSSRTATRKMTTNFTFSSVRSLPRWARVPKPSPVLAESAWWAEIYWKILNYAKLGFYTGLFPFYLLVADMLKSSHIWPPCVQYVSIRMTPEPVTFGPVRSAFRSISESLGTWGHSRKSVLSASLCCLVSSVEFNHKNFICNSTRPQVQIEQGSKNKHWEEAQNVGGKGFKVILIGLNLGFCIYLCVCFVVPGRAKILRMSWHE